MTFLKTNEKFISSQCNSYIYMYRRFNNENILKSDIHLLVTEVTSEI